jgi:N-methylhydantoinase A
VTDNPAATLAAAIAATRGGARAATGELLYSTTLAVNALLTHALPRIGLVVTAGFRDLLETARLPAPADAAPGAPPAPRLVPLEWVRELGARHDARGAERRALDPDEVRAIAREYRDAGIDVVAVSLLHSYLDDSHERAVARLFAEVAPAIRVVLSCTVLPELREYERTVAAALNACLIPVMAAHLAALGADAVTPMLLMKSSGGLASVTSAAGRPLATALSGPGAAVVGMAWLGRSIGYRDLITLDIGGTSTDVALVRDGRYALTTRGTIAGFPFTTPMIDVLTIGAGGGSLAHAGPDSRWHVGPASAGAVPGPVCYGRGGTQVTLTDAHLVLGRLPGALLGGSLPLDADAAHAALAAFGQRRGLDAIATARGLLEIASHNMCGAIRRVSVQRGYDPADYALMAMGGAGPLHAAELALLLGIRTVIVPPQPGLAAAFGLLVADIEEDFVQVCGMREDALEGGRIARDFAWLERRAGAFLAEEGVAPAARRLARHLDVRYAGMSAQHTVALPAGTDPAAAVTAAIAAFHAHWLEMTGHDHRGREAVEIVNLRVRATGVRDKPALPRPPAPRAAPRPGTRPIAFLGHPDFVASAVHARDTLAPGATCRGPAVIEQYESTIIVPPGCSASVDDWGNVIIRAAVPGE